MALFNNVPLKEGYQNYANTKFTLPISMKNFWQLWYDNKGPVFADSYMTEKDSINNK